MAVKLKETKQTLNNKGFASIEAVAMLFILVSILNYTLGTFGAIHTGILNSISARAYMFEIMDHRADLNYLRSHPIADPGAKPFRTLGFRFVGISSEFQNEPVFRATARNVNFMEHDPGDSSGSPLEHAKIQELNLGERLSTGVDNVWVKTVYGICLTATCGGI